MRIIVVDTNIVFSAILWPKGTLATFLRLKKLTKIQLYAPEYILVELARHSEKLVTISGKEVTEISELQRHLLEETTIVPDTDIPFEYFFRAAGLLREVDLDDVAFVALNDYLNGYLVTGDKHLINGLKRKGYSRILSFSQLLEEE